MGFSRNRANRPRCSYKLYYLYIMLESKFALSFLVRSTYRGHVGVLVLNDSFAIFESINRLLSSDRFIFMYMKWLS